MYENSDEKLDAAGWFYFGNKGTQMINHNNNNNEKNSDVEYEFSGEEYELSDDNKQAVTQSFVYHNCPSVFFFTLKKTNP